MYKHRRQSSNKNIKTSSSSFSRTQKTTNQHNDHLYKDSEAKIKKYLNNANYENDFGFKNFKNVIDVGEIPFEKIKIVITNKGTIKISGREELGSGFSSFENKQSLPYYVLAEGLLKDVKTNYENGKVYIELPESGKVPENVQKGMDLSKFDSNVDSFTITRNADAIQVSVPNSIPSGHDNSRGHVQLSTSQSGSQKISSLKEDPDTISDKGSASVVSVSVASGPGLRESVGEDESIYENVSRSSRGSNSSRSTTIREVIESHVIPNDDDNNDHNNDIRSVHSRGNTPTASNSRQATHMRIDFPVIIDDVSDFEDDTLSIASSNRGHLQQQTRSSSRRASINPNHANRNLDIPNAPSLTGLNINGQPAKTPKNQKRVVFEERSSFREEYFEEDDHDAHDDDRNRNFRR